MPRNAFYGDGMDNVDFGLYKNFRVRTYNLSLRIEAYNVFNTVQYGFPALSLTTQAAIFGQLTALHSLYHSAHGAGGRQVPILISVTSGGFC